MDPILPLQTPTAPLTAPQAAAPPPEQSPQDRYAPGARIFAPDKAGGFQRTTLIPADDQPPMARVTGLDGQPRAAFTSQDGRRFHQMTEAGRADFSLDVPDRVGEFVFDPSHGRYLLRTGQGLLSVDAGSGQVVASKPFDSFGFQRRVALTPVGDVLLADERSLSVLDADLRPRETHALDFRADFLRQVGGATLVGEDSNGRLAVASPGRPLVPLSSDARLASVVEGSDGRVWFLEGGTGTRSPRAAVSYNPVSGESRRFRTTADAGYLVPLPDGRVLVYDHRLAAPRIRLYDAEGDEQKTFTMGKDCYLRQFFVTHDGRQAYAVTDRYGEDGPTTRTLLRMDLSAGREGLGGWISERLGLDQPAEELHRTVDQPFIPCAMEDGRIAILSQKGVEMLGEQGAPEDLAGLLRSGARPAAARVRVDCTADGPIPGGLRDYIETAALSFGLPVPRDGDGWSYSARDAALHRTEPVPGSEALRELGLAGEQDYLKLTQARTLFNTALQDRVVPFPGLAGGKVEVGTRSARTWLPGAPGTREMQIREPGYFTTALPVLAAGIPCLALASSDGILSWHDLSSGTEQKFDVGARVVGLMAGPDRLYAVAEDGRVLLLRVPIKPGEDLQVPPEFRVAGGAAAPAAPAIQAGEDSVLIGTVRLERRRG